MTPRRETCRWVEKPSIVRGGFMWPAFSTSCGQYFVAIADYHDCPHCGGRIVREEGK